VALAARHARGDERVLVDGRLGVELARVDGGLQPGEVDLDVAGAGRLVEAALGETLVERHLAALEAVDRDARPRLLAFDAAAAGLALARADPAADAHSLLERARVVAQFVELHVLLHRLGAGLAPRRSFSPGRA